MANIVSDNLYEGSFKVFHTTKANRIKAFNSFWVDNLDDNLDNAIRAGIAGYGGGTTVGNLVVPLEEIRARWVRNDRALCVAKFGIPGGGGRNTGFSSIEMQGGVINVQWIQTSAPGDKFNGIRPDGNDNLDARGRIKPYSLTIPVWHVSVKTILSFNPAPVIGGRLSKINSGDVTWDGFLVRAKTARFDTATIKYIGDDEGRIKRYFVIYNFTLRPDEWHDQRLVRTSQATGAEFNRVNHLMYDPVSFTTPTIPVGSNV